MTVSDCLKAVMDKVEGISKEFERMKKTGSSFSSEDPRGKSQEPANGSKKRSFEELKQLYDKLK